MRTITLIAAVDEEGGIGKAGRMPWKYKEDLSFFKRATAGAPCIFGRKTFDTFKPKNTMGRTFYVLSRHTSREGRHVVLGETSYSPGALSTEPWICPTLSSALDVCRTADQVFVCGGAQVYEEALPFAHKLMLTRIPGVWGCDVFFPSLPEEWRRVGGFDLSHGKVGLSVDIMRKFVTVESG